MVYTLVAWAATPSVHTPRPIAAVESASLRPAVEQVDAWQAEEWAAAEVAPADAADELTILRRLSLALHGTIPSLEEIRNFEADSRDDRLDQTVAAMLVDRRFGDYFARRLSRSMVGVEDGPFIVFRRDKLNDWLSERLRTNQPYDETVRELISQTGLWTGMPATNFITVAAERENNVDENKLTARTVRAFLGQRMDCAQCHDDFVNGIWQQSQFEGLAAFYGQTRLTALGVEDKTKWRKKPVEYEIVAPGEETGRTVAPVVPFHEEWLPEEGTRREQLAAWITHPDNARFERAIVNRVWGLMFGRARHTPVDDLPAPPQDEANRGPLDILGNDFRANGCDLHRLIRTIASTRAFQLASQHPVEDAAEFEEVQRAGAVFPMVRLRPEQVIGAMLQAGYVRTIDQNSHLFVRIRRYFGEQDFVRQYGDAGDDELTERAGTIPQALLRMNGKLPREIAKTDPFGAPNRLIQLSPSDAELVENAFLVCLTRRPTDTEVEHFLGQFQDATEGERNRTTTDIFWSLFNSPEFSWNH